jgi:hypothetical protein
MNRTDEHAWDEESDAKHDLRWVIAEQPDKALKEVFKESEHSCQQLVAAIER